MAGRGPAPKNPAERARRNKSTGPELRVIETDPADQPPLPDGEWHPQTLEWWRMWARSPLSETFTETDWSDLMDAALIHSALWSGDKRMAAELRQRMGQFGSNLESRARLRIQFAQADEADAKRPEKRAGGSRREGLRLAE